MRLAKITITLDEGALSTVDRWVQQGRYPNRSKAIQAAVAEKVKRWRRTRLNEELSKLDKQAEQEMAEEMFSGKILIGWARNVAD
jgi:Arc/MetJ-type ribon-helix-helix transcriptional regulator